jgi:DNA-binding transcriptional LysR family regulator
MARKSVDDLIAFLAVAREQSFTRAAARLGVSQPALSQTIRTLEGRLGVRLLTRTTRSVSTTEAGERLLQTVGPHFDGIEAGLAALSELRDKPAGSLRITSVEHASQTILAPALAKLLPDYPDISVEIINDYGLSDIVADRYDAGIRLGEQVTQDMIAVRIGPDFGMAVVGSPSYFKSREPPITPHDLTAHICIGLRLPTSGGLWTWPFAKDERELKVRPQGQMAFNTITLALDMAVAGLGLAYLPQDTVSQHLATGDLIQVLADWSPPASGYHLYYPSRRQPTPAFALLVDAVRYRQRGAGIRGAAALAPTPAQITPCGRSSGVPGPACD